MKTLSNNFKLDNGNEIWQRSLIERQKRLELTNRPKTKPQGVTLMIKKLSIKDNDKKQSHLQAFFTKKYRKDTK